jgi:hypothetical protein
MTRTYPLGASNIEKFRANKMPNFTSYFESFFANARAHTVGVFEVFKNVSSHG